jgi:hypothetical protein
MVNKKIVLISVAVVIIIMAMILLNLLLSGNDKLNGEHARDYTATFEHWESGMEERTYDLQEGESQTISEDTGENVYTATFILTWYDDSTFAPDDFTLTVSSEGNVMSYDPSNSVTSNTGNIQIKAYITDPPPEIYRYQANSTSDAKKIVHDLYDTPNMIFNIAIQCGGDNAIMDTGNEVTFNNYYNGFTISSVAESE